MHAARSSRRRGSYSASQQLDHARPNRSRRRRHFPDNGGLAPRRRFCRRSRPRLWPLQAQPPFRLRQALDLPDLRGCHPWYAPSEDSRHQRGALRAPWSRISCANLSRSSPAALPERRPITETESLARLFGLPGRTAVVVGASGVLGSALAKGLAGAGARVAVVGRRIEACERVATVIRQDAGEALAVAADGLDRSSRELAAAERHTRFGPLDHLA